MTHHTELVEDLRRYGHRLTPQRDMILAAIKDSAGHVSAEEICQKVQAKYPYVNISTVYRTLDLLKKLRMVTETDLGQGCIKYELIERGKHHHLVCHRCGKIQKLDHRFLEPLSDLLRREYDFSADIDHFAIFGLCGDCQQATTAS